MTAANQNTNHKVWNNMVINTLSFKQSIYLVTGKDMGVFIDKWIRSGGHAMFHMDFHFNRKRCGIACIPCSFGIIHEFHAI